MSREYSLEWRKSQLLNHPVFKQNMIGCFWTGPVEQLFQQVSRFMILRQSAYVEGATGTGKSTAMGLVIRRLSALFNEMPFVNFNGQADGALSERATLKEFLTVLQHEKTSGETSDLRTRVRRRLEERGVNSSSGMIVLWVDEAQALSVTDFLFLRDVQNGLRKVEVDLIVFLTGEEPFLHRRIEDAKWDASRAVADRFAMKRLLLRGYGLDDVRHLFAQVDTAEWPDASGITWTQFFFPKAFETGFRFQSQALACISALESAKLLSHDGTCQPRLLKLVFQRFFLDHTREDKEEFTAPADAWLEAVSDAIDNVDPGAGEEERDDEDDEDGHELSL